jgi:hypothetical protein
MVGLIATVLHSGWDALCARLLFGVRARTMLLSVSQHLVLIYFADQCSVHWQHSRISVSFNLYNGTIINVFS